MIFKAGTMVEYRCRSCLVVKRYISRILLQCGDLKVITTDDNIVKDIKRRNK